MHQKNGSFSFTSVGRSDYVAKLRPKRLHCFQKSLYLKIKLLNRAMYSKVSIFLFSPCPHSLCCSCYLTKTHRLQYALIVVPSERGYQIMGYSSCFLQFKQSQLGISVMQKVGCSVPNSPFLSSRCKLLCDLELLTGITS